jgi:hypothetical protein
LITIWVTVFCEASYPIPLPLTLLTVKVLLVLSLLMLPLVRVQLPVLAVTQLSVPPGTKLPVTVAG